VKIKSLLTILLAIAACGMTAYLIVFESGWVIPQEGKRQINSDELSRIVAEAKAYRKTGQPQKAIEILKKALEKEPNNFALNLELGISYEQNGDIDLAVSAYEKASSINPKHYLPYKLLGFLYFNRKKDRAKAEKYLEQSLALNPNQPDVQRFLDNMRGQPIAIPKRPQIPTMPGRSPRPIAPVPTVPDPRPQIPKIPLPSPQ
jgi:tetratricopeptide (TPR) repeat protein